LGLSLSYEIAKLYGAEIIVETKEGEEVGYYSIIHCLITDLLDWKIAGLKPLIQNP
jgi:hypothetical protein